MGQDGKDEFGWTKQERIDDWKEQIKVRQEYLKMTGKEGEPDAELQRLGQELSKEL